MKRHKTSIKKWWKQYSNYLFLIFLIAATVTVIWTQVDLKVFVNTLKKANLMFLGLGILCVMVYWLLEGYMILKLLQRDQKNERFSFAMVVTIVGQYYNLITPGSSGGQPLQLYEMTKRGYSMGSGTAVLVQKYALYQITVTLIAVLATLLNLNYINTGLPAVRGLVAVGLIINIAGALLVIMMALNAELCRRFLTGCVRFLNRLHIIKDVAGFYDKIDQFVDDYRSAIDGLKKNKLETLGLFGVSAAQILVFFSINYLVYRSLGLSGASPFLIISMQAILYVAVAFIPTPGAAGGAEAGFALVFAPIYGSVNTSVGLVVWRIITFYFIILFGGIFLAVRSALLGRKQRKEKGV